MRELAPALTVVGAAGVAAVAALIVAVSVQVRRAEREWKDGRGARLVPAPPARAPAPVPAAPPRGGRDD